MRRKIQMLVVLPGVADTAENLEAVLAQVDPAFTDEGLGDAGRFPAVIICTDAACRRQRDGLAHLQRETGVGEQVFHRLERADRPTEGDALLCVRHGRREVGVHRTDRLGAVSTQASASCRATRSAAAPGSPTIKDDGTRTPSSRISTKSRDTSSDSSGESVTPGESSGSKTCVGPAGRRRGDQQPAVRAGVVHESGAPGQLDGVAAALRLHRTGEDRPTGFGNRARRPRLRRTSGTAAPWLAARRCRPLRSRTRRHSCRRTDQVAGAVHGCTRRAPRPPRHCRRRCHHRRPPGRAASTTQLACLPAVGIGVRRVVVRPLPHLGQRAGPVDETHRGIQQHPLVARHIVIHGDSPRDSGLE